MAKKQTVHPEVNLFHNALNAAESKAGRFLTTAEVMRIFNRMQPKLRKAILKGIEQRRRPAKPKKAAAPKLAVVK